MQTKATFVFTLLLGITMAVPGPAAAEPQPLDIADRWELFVRDDLVEHVTGDAQLRLHHPVDQGKVLNLDAPWEGGFSTYGTVIKDGDVYRMYYRALGVAGRDTNTNQKTAYAESEDGKNWTKPKLNLHEINGSKENNVILLGDEHPAATSNFAPFLDTRPGVPHDERFKAVAGLNTSKVLAFASGDGIRWRQMQEEPIYDPKAFRDVLDSQNVAFWSEAEQQYVFFYRRWINGMRTVAKATSPDFINWSESELMRYSDSGSTTPSDHLYTNQTHPYYRNPHLYISTAARFMKDRQVVTEHQAGGLGVHPKYFGDTSDVILLTTRPDSRVYDRTFKEGLIRPGIGLTNWISRTNYPMLNVVPTGEHEMSIYVNQDYAQPTNHVRRYTLRVDGFASIHAGAKGGEVLTPAVVFKGDQLVINFATSAAGRVQVELLDEAGKPIEGFTLANAREQIGNEIERVVTWTNDADLSALAGQPVRLRFVFKDADVYSFRFRDDD